MTWDVGAVALAVIIGLVAINQVAMRMPGLRGQWYVFAPLQVMNLAVGVWAVVYGVPGLEKWALMSYVVAMLFLFRLVQNTAVFVNAKREQREDEPNEVDVRLAELREKFADEREKEWEEEERRQWEAAGRPDAMPPREEEPPAEEPKPPER